LLPAVAHGFLDLGVVDDRNNPGFDTFFEFSILDLFYRMGADNNGEQQILPQNAVVILFSGLSCHRTQRRGGFFYQDGVKTDR